jgi:hypothetical protein
MTAVSIYRHRQLGVFLWKATAVTTERTARKETSHRRLISVMRVLVNFANMGRNIHLSSPYYHSPSLGVTIPGH